MTYLVYKHTSPSGKSYIGLTCDYGARCSQHQYPDSSTCTAFAAAVRKYGWENFIHTVLKADVTETEAKYYEKLFILEHNTLHPSGYNLTTGGEGHRISDITKSRISAARKLLIGKIQQYDKPDCRNTYSFIDKNGTIHTTTNLKSFCAERGMYVSNMYSVATGKLKSYKGWRLP